MKFSTQLSFLLIFVLLLTACNGRNSQQSDESDITMTVVAETTTVGNTTLTITLTDPTGAGIDNAELTIKGDMSHAGMQPVLANTSGGQSGIYNVPFEWTMGGDWIVTVDAMLADGRSLSRQFDFSISN